MGTYETSNLVAILAAGRNPVWTEQLLAGVADYDGAPSTSAHGASMGDAIMAMVCVQLRREVHRRTAYITLTFDAATTYTITINGTAHTPTPGANLAALVADTIADINAGAEAAEVTASEESTGVVKVVGDIEADFSIEVGVSGGTGTIACTADPSTATARVFVMGASPDAPGRLLGDDAESSDPGVWVTVPAGEYSLDYRGMMERLTVAGCERLYVELDDIAGHADDGAEVVYTPHVFLGPCAVETSS